MVTRTLERISVAEYLARERDSEIRHEYVHGEIFEMPGVSRNHSRIAMNLTLTLGNQLDPATCEIHCPNLGVRVSYDIYYYPDLSIVCGEQLFEEAGDYTLLNPTLVVEVTSPSSIGRDCGEKLENYKLIPSLEGVLILDQHRVLAELHTRESDGWEMRSFNEADDIIHLPMLECDIPLSAVYRGVAAPSLPD